ncbi:unknown protein [Arabidopsis thaliana]|uniref:At3g11690 n=5 Tax=Arabidopsis TaxID=3701 RepID=Q9SRM8_ARATH|nr:uncharacterized protein AT3G11690 [Arabidopsis thaliana]KAG7624857.1 hypothetical protein ISN45_At03g011470 [Arabidopsis thaliana x Arabidopsis arenosa]KAG7630876.1 hypothetical protein ISN44_As03g011550 [Arabidopsis suecica]AAF02136.1 unknown protein [Arabidopsis thaliana]ACF75544.1 At3g11690 [Arabidopsis thaliana]AEE75084.1 hypothetical protein AT3G11690 [Arabidopsis thaliana]|eukprot:NP_566397.1 hypothetical protein AT3G11690 [Arabidopsis thaliana]
MNTTLRYDPRQISRQTKPSDTPSSSPSRSNRRQPLLQRSLSSPSPRASCGGSTPAEFCGGTTASCAAVWCCCPCGLVNLLVLAIYKVPKGICRRAIRSRRRKQLVKNGILPPLPTDGKNERMQRVFQNSEFAIHPLDSDDVSDDEDDDNFLDLKYIGKSVATGFTTEEETDEDDEAVLALEKEMWNRFYGAGFWRSPSQRESVSSPRVSKSLSSSPRQSFTEVYRNRDTTVRGGGGGATVVAATPRAVRHFD